MGNSYRHEEHALQDAGNDLAATGARGRPHPREAKGFKDGNGSLHASPDRAVCSDIAMMLNGVITEDECKAFIEHFGSPKHAGERRRLIVLLQELG